MPSTFQILSIRSPKQSTQSNPRLPPEVILNVLYHINCTDTLFNFMRTSRVFWGDTEKLLYTGKCSAYDTWSKRRHRGFLHRVSTTPRLAASVRVYSIRDIPVEDQKFVLVLCPALEAMVNLKELTYQSTLPALCLLNKCTFQLTSFVLLSAHERPEHILAFLGGQPNLTRIDLEYHSANQIYRIMCSFYRSGHYKNTERIGHLIWKYVRDIKHKKSLILGSKTFFHLPVSREGIIQPDDSSVSHLLHLMKEACIGVRPDTNRKRGVLNSFVFHLTNVHTLELVNSPEEDIRQTALLSSLKTLSITSPIVPLRTPFQRKKYIARTFTNCVNLKDLYIHCPSYSDAKRPSEDWVYERWTKEGKQETKTRGEWGKVFTVQWDPDSMVINRCRPPTCVFDLEKPLKDIISKSCIHP